MSFSFSIKYPESSAHSIFNPSSSNGWSQSLHLIEPPDDVFLNIDSLELEESDIPEVVSICLLTYLREFVVHKRSRYLVHFLPPKDFSVLNHRLLEVFEAPIDFLNLFKVLKLSANNIKKTSSHSDFYDIIFHSCKYLHASCHRFLRTLLPIDSMRIISFLFPALKSLDIRHAHVENLTPLSSLPLVFLVTNIPSVINTIEFHSQVIQPHRLFTFDYNAEIRDTIKSKQTLFSTLDFLSILQIKGFPQPLKKHSPIWPKFFRLFSSLQQKYWWRHNHLGTDRDGNPSVSFTPRTWMCFVSRAVPLTDCPEKSTQKMWNHTFTLFIESNSLQPFQYSVAPALPQELQLVNEIHFGQLSFFIPTSLQWTTPFHKIDWKYFFQLRFLRYLSLLTPSLSNLNTLSHKRLHYLKIIPNNLTTLCTNISTNFPQLQELYIIGPNSVSELPLMKSATLRIFSLSTFNIGSSWQSTSSKFSIHYEFGKYLPKLEKLDISFHGFLDTFPNIFGQNLTQLSLSGSNIQKICQGFGIHLPKLVQLNLDHTRLENLSFTEFQCPKLKTLSLVGSGIKVIHSMTGNLPNLEFLDLSFTKSLKILPFLFFPSLTLLNLNHSGIQVIEPNFGRNLPKLTELRFDSTQSLDSLPPLSCCSLNILSLKNSSIKTIDPILLTPRLTRLNLSKTKISFLPDIHCPELNTITLELFPSVTEIAFDSNFGIHIPKLKFFLIGKKISIPYHIRQNLHPNCTMNYGLVTSDV